LGLMASPAARGEGGGSIFSGTEEKGEERNHLPTRTGRSRDQKGKNTPILATKNTKVTSNSTKSENQKKEGAEALLSRREKQNVLILRCAN